MKNIKELKEENERIMRELAESCRDEVEWRFAYNRLSSQLEDQKKAFINFLVNEGYAATKDEAEIRLKDLSQQPPNITQKKTPPIKMETDLY